MVPSQRNSWNWEVFAPLWGWDYLASRKPMTTSYLYQLRRSSMTWPCPPLSPYLGPCPHPPGPIHLAFQFTANPFPTTEALSLEFLSLWGILLAWSASHDNYFSSSIPLSLLQRGAKSTQNTTSLSWYQIHFPYNLLNRLLILFLVSNYNN